MVPGIRFRAFASKVLDETIVYFIRFFKCKVPKYIIRFTPLIITSAKQPISTPRSQTFLNSFYNKIFFINTSWEGRVWKRRHIFCLDSSLPCPCFILGLNISKTLHVSQKKGTNLILIYIAASLIVVSVKLC